MKSFKDYYSVLGIAPESDFDKIKVKFMQLAKKHHPESKGGDKKKTSELVEAFEFLSNESVRSKYDVFLYRKNGNSTKFNTLSSNQIQGYTQLIIQHAEICEKRGKHFPKHFRDFRRKYDSKIWKSILESIVEGISLVNLRLIRKKTKNNATKKNKIKA